MFKLPNEVIAGIEDYKKSLNEFMDGKMNDSRFKGIRVPWGFYSHRGGKIFMSRIRIPGGEVTGSQLKAIAEMSKKYGNSIPHITTRQDIQIHGVKIEDTAKVMDYLKEYNLCPRGGGGNTVRNVMSCSMSGICPSEVFDVRQYAIVLTEYLLKDPNSYMLPRKYKIAFSGCSKGCGLTTVNDIGFIAKKVNGKIGFSVYAGGGMGAVSRVGDLLEEFILPLDSGYVTEAVKRVFFKYGERKDRHHSRLRFLVSKIGFNEFKKLYMEELKRLKETEYISFRKIDFSYPVPVEEEIYAGDSGGSTSLTTLSERSESNEGFEVFRKYNVHSQKQKGNYIIEIRMPLGDISADKLIALTKMGDYEYRTTQMQNLYIANVKAGEVYSVYKRLKELGLALPYASSILDITCCAGATTCNLGLCNSKGLTTEIDRALGTANLNLDNFKNINIKVNGCPNACGQHPIATIGLHGLVRKVGERVVPFYKILFGGRFDEGKARLAEEVGVAPARNIPILIKEFLLSVQNKVVDYDYIISGCKKIMDDLISKYAYVPSYEEDPLFYRDWGKEGDFTLVGIGPGECGAGVIDMINADLESAGAEIAKNNPKEAIHLSARALLVVRGIEPRTREEALDSFIKEFVRKGIADIRFSDIKEKIDYNYAIEFYNEVKRIYNSMDSSFNFPAASMVSEKKEENVKLLDLRGVACPMNYVKTKLYLENLDIDSVVEVYLDDGEPIRNVPSSLKTDGQDVIKIENKGGFFSVVVKKKV